MPVRSRNAIFKHGYVSNPTAKTLISWAVEHHWPRSRLSPGRAYPRQTSPQRLPCALWTASTAVLRKPLGEIILVDHASSAASAKRPSPAAQVIATSLKRCKVVLDHQADRIVCADVVEHLFDPIPYISAHVPACNSAAFRALLKRLRHLTQPVRRLSPPGQAARLSLQRFLGLSRWHSC
jgi:hypothetical protein